jgi:hypothetical protein
MHILIVFVVGFFPFVKGQNVTEILTKTDKSPEADHDGPIVIEVKNPLNRMFNSYKYWLKPF